MADKDLAPPVLSDKDYEAPSVFRPEALLREARRQKSLPPSTVPPICILDPDGDIERRLRQEGRGAVDPAWPCYHTELYRFHEFGLDFGIVGRAVGAPFAVLIAEQLFASGCRLLISMTSAGQLLRVQPPPYFVLIERALRDEGTSYHYLPPATFSGANPRLLRKLGDAFRDLPQPPLKGTTWTTDAPYRETRDAVLRRTAQGLLAVEMEAAALYAFAEATGNGVICFAHVTNQMGQVGDFEKGEGDGTAAALSVIVATAQQLS